MSDSVTVVLIDNGDTEPEVMIFENEELAEEWAAVRGACIDTVTAEPISDNDARRLIADEIKERRDEERMRQAGL